MAAVTQIFLVTEIQLFKVKHVFSLIVLTKQRGSDILTQIMTFIKTHRNEKYYSSNQLNVCKLQYGFVFVWFIALLVHCRSQT